MFEAWPEPVERVARVLAEAGVEGTVQEFREGTLTGQDAADAVGANLSRIVKSLVFTAGGVYVLAMVPGDRRADAGKLAALVDVERVKTASPEQVLDATGFEPGAVAPFPRGKAQFVFVEQSLLSHARVWIGAGSHAHMASLAPSDLEYLSGAVPADIV